MSVPLRTSYRGATQFVRTGFKVHCACLHSSRSWCATARYDSQTEDVIVEVWDYILDVDFGRYVFSKDTHGTSPVVDIMFMDDPTLVALSCRENSVRKMSPDVVPPACGKALIAVVCGLHIYTVNYVSQMASKAATIDQRQAITTVMQYASVPRLALGCVDGCVHVWSFGHGAGEGGFRKFFGGAKVTKQHTGSVTAVALVPREDGLDERDVVAAYSDATLAYWDAVSSSLRFSASKVHDGIAVVAMSVNHNNSTLVSTCSNGTLASWQLPSLKPLHHVSIAGIGRGTIIHPYHNSFLSNCFWTFGKNGDKVYSIPPQVMIPRGGSSTAQEICSIPAVFPPHSLTRKGKKPPSFYSIASHPSNPSILALCTNIGICVVRVRQVADPSVVFVPPTPASAASPSRMGTVLYVDDVGVSEAAVHVRYTATSEADEFQSTVADAVVGSASKVVSMPGSALKLGRRPGLLLSTNAKFLALHDATSVEIGLWAPPAGDSRQSTWRVVHSAQAISFAWCSLKHLERFAVVTDESVLVPVVTQSAKRQTLRGKQKGAPTKLMQSYAVQMHDVIRKPDGAYEAKSSLTVPATDKDGRHAVGVFGGPLLSLVYAVKNTSGSADGSTVSSPSRGPRLSVKFGVGGSESGPASPVARGKDKSTTEEPGGESECLPHQTMGEKLQFFSWTTGEPVGEPMAPVTGVYWDDNNSFLALTRNRGEIHLLRLAEGCLMAGGHCAVGEDIVSAIWHVCSLYVATTSHITVIYPHPNDMSAIRIADVTLPTLSVPPSLLSPGSESAGRRRSTVDQDPLSRRSSAVDVPDHGSPDGGGGVGVARAGVMWRPPGNVTCVTVVAGGLLLHYQKNEFQFLPLVRPDLQFRALVTAGETTEAMMEALPYVSGDPRIRTSLATFLGARGHMDHALAVPGQDPRMRLRLCVEYSRWIDSITAAETVVEQAKRRYLWLQTQGVVPDDVSEMFRDSVQPIVQAALRASLNGHFEEASGLCSVAQQLCSWAESRMRGESGLNMRDVDAEHSCDDNRVDANPFLQFVPQVQRLRAEVEMCLGVVRARNGSWRDVQELAVCCPPLSVPGIVSAAHTRLNEDHKGVAPSSPSQSEPERPAGALLLSLGSDESGPSGGRPRDNSKFAQMSLVDVRGGAEVSDAVWRAACKAAVASSGDDRTSALGALTQNLSKKYPNLPVPVYSK
eukprot:Rmarinus@m.4951